jgi:ATP-dependent Clp protease ATP-binding subunit ClpA
MYERFTERARNVMQLADQEARRLRHDYIGTEHILLGIIKEGSGVASNVLKNLDINVRKIRREIEKIVTAQPDRANTGKLIQTPRAKKVLEYSIGEACNLNHDYVGTEHLLLGLLRERTGVAAQVLKHMGLKVEDVREAMLSFLDSREEITFEDQLERIEVDLAELPPPIQEAMRALRIEIDKLNQEKEDAIAIQDFERAAVLRDRAVRLMNVQKLILPAQGEDKDHPAQDS